MDRWRRKAGPSLCAHHDMAGETRVAPLKAHKHSDGARNDLMLHDRNTNFVEKIHSNLPILTQKNCSLPTRDDTIWDNMDGSPPDNDKQ